MIGPNSNKAIFKDTVGTCPKTFQCTAACGFDKLSEGAKHFGIPELQQVSIANVLNLKPLALIPDKVYSSPLQGKGQ